MCERWLPTKLTAWAAGSDEIDALLSHVGAMDRDDWGCWMVLRAGMDDAGHIGCHRIQGEGGVVGPDLSFVGYTSPEQEWHLKHFRDPQSVSSGSIMPKMPFTELQINDLASYMLTLKRAQ